MLGDRLVGRVLPPYPLNARLLMYLRVDPLAFHAVPMLMYDLCPTGSLAVASQNRGVTAISGQHTPGIASVASPIASYAASRDLVKHTSRPEKRAGLSLDGHSATFQKTS